MFPWILPNFLRKNRREEEFTQSAIFYSSGLKQISFVAAWYGGDQKLQVSGPPSQKSLPGRRWDAGIHQAVEAKEGVPIRPEQIAKASISYQGLFHLYGNQQDRKRGHGKGPRQETSKLVKKCPWALLSQGRPKHNHNHNYPKKPWTGKSCFSNRALVKAIFEAPKCL